MHASWTPMPMRPCPYSTMPLPALSTNAGCAKHASRALALQFHPCKARPADFPSAAEGRSCAAVLLRILHYFLLHFPHYFFVSAFPAQKKRQGYMPWRVAPQVRLELTTLRLTAECSAIELLRIIRGLWCGLLSVRRFACQLPALLRLALAHAPASHSASGSALAHASASGLLCRLAAPFSLMFWEREKLSFLPLLLDPGNFLLSQAVPSSVPSAFGGLTSVFGMGTGGALQLSSPETFRGEASLSLPLPAPSKLHSNRVDPQTFTLPNLLPSLPFALSTASALSLPPLPSPSP